MIEARHEVRLALCRVVPACNLRRIRDEGLETLEALNVGPSPKESVQLRCRHDQ